MAEQPVRFRYEANCRHRRTELEFKHKRAYVGLMHEKQGAR